MKHKTILMLLLALTPFCVWAQSDGYNPPSPGDPQVPQKKYLVSIKAEPSYGGDVTGNVIDGDGGRDDRFQNNDRYAAGTSIRFEASPNSGFHLKQWAIGDSIVPANGRYMVFTVPEKATNISAQFVYDPASPANPSTNRFNRSTGEVTIEDFTSDELVVAIESVVNYREWEDVKKITVTGDAEMTYHDFQIQQFSNCTQFDLSKATGVREIHRFSLQSSSLKALYLPDCVEVIDYYAFSGVRNLRVITLGATTPPRVEGTYFSGVSSDLVVFVPLESLPLYKADAAWSRLNLKALSSFDATPADPETWNNLLLPHNITVGGTYESVLGLDGKIEYAVEDNVRWTAMTDTIASGTQFSETISVNFTQGKPQHTIRFRSVDVNGNTTALPSIVYDDISAYTFSGLKSYTFTGDSIYQEELQSDLAAEKYKIGRYANNVHAGRASVYVEGVYPYTIGTKALTFQILPAQLSGDIAISEDSTYTYNGYSVEPSWKFTSAENEKLRNGVDYYCSYTDNIYPGTATLTVVGTGDYTGTLQKTFNIEKAELPAGAYTVELPASDITYDGREHTANVATVKNGVGDVRIVYYKNGEDDAMATPPVDDGEYDVHVNIEDGEYYLGKEEKVGTFHIYKLSADEWQMLATLNDAMKQMGREDVWNMDEGIAAAASLSGVTIKKGHVKALNLSSQHLTGELPLGILALPELKTLDISHNQLRGNLSIVGSAMPMLESLNASDNNFADVKPMLPTTIKNLDISRQTIDSTIVFDMSRSRVDEAISLLPTILTYNHQMQSYDTDYVAYLLTTAEAPDWYGQWAMAARYEDGELSIPFVTTPFEYRGQSGDTLHIVKLNNGGGNSVEGSNLKIKLLFRKGDVDFKSGFDAADVQSTVLYIFGDYENRPFNFTAADTFEDGAINVQDVVCTVNMLLDEAVGQAVAYRKEYSSASRVGELQRGGANEGVDAEAYIFLSNGKVVLRTNTPIAALCIKASGDVAWTIDGLGMEQSARESSVVGYSLNGTTLPIGDTVIGSYTGTPNIWEASLADGDAQAIKVAVVEGMPTGIENVNVMDENDSLQDADIYNTQGIKMNNMRRGINIVKKNNEIRKMIVQ